MLLWLCLQADLNVSLTSINLLWNAADLLAKRSVHSLNAGRKDDSAPLQNGSGPSLLDREKFEELLRFLFESIQVCHLVLRCSCIVFRPVSALVEEALF